MHDQLFYDSYKRMQQRHQKQNIRMSDDEFDIDNMDFDLPQELVAAPVPQPRAAPQLPFGMKMPEYQAPEPVYQPANMNAEQEAFTKEYAAYLTI